MHIRRIPLLECFPPFPAVLSFIGAGGKTSLMFRLAHELHRKNPEQLIITTTSTKIYPPSYEQSPHLLVHSDINTLVDWLNLHPCSPTTIAAQILNNGKLRGFTADELDQWHHNFPQTTLLVEADGAAGHSLKAHHTDEPVLPSSTDTIVALVGIDVLGKPLDEHFVHRPRKLSELLNRPLGSTIRIDDIATLMAHPKGYFHNAPPTAKRILCLNKISSKQEKKIAEDIARAVLSNSATKIDSVIVGSLQSDHQFTIYSLDLNSFTA